MGGGGGRGGRARTQRKHFRQSRENVWKRPKSDPSSDANENNNSNNDRSGHNNNPWEPFSTENPIFNEYYKEQGIVSADEWDAFIAVIRTPLPAAFRINSSSQFCADIRSQLENEFMKSLQAEVINDGEVQAIRPLPWYPQNLAWHSNFSRMQLRKNQTLERFHNFLKLENEIGNITRQEAVSMVPPLFLDVHPEHFVLDMCAAPGSKTFQLLEIVHQSTKPGFLPDGMVVANDLDVQRCNLLIHQTKRMCTANLVVTNHEAQHFPGCRLKRNSSNASEVGIESNPCMSQLIFDRVLCDVPCSGDGTLRKAPDIWRKWNVGMGNGIHGLQIQIAIRGVSLLKVGGRMVYSTCSMNPVENEAVVAEILRRCEGSLELLDVSSELPQLVLRPGLRKWKIRDKGSWLASYKDVKKYRKTVIYPSMFPSGRSYVDSSDSNDKKGSEERPEDDSNDKKESEERPEDDSNDKKESEEKPEDDSNGDSTDGVQMVDTSTIPADGLDEEVCEFPLERCMRILPHDQNTGAFFIAVFKKVSPLPTMKNKQDNRDKGDNYTNDKPVLELPNQELEDIDGLNINSAERTDEKLPEGASKADLIDDGPNEASKKDDPSATAEENNSTEAQEPVEKEIDPKKTRGKRKLQMQGKWKGVDPVVILKDETIINGIKSFYGIDESFPFHGHLVTRNSDITHMKRIYYISKSVKDVLELNFSVGQQLKIASIGIKMFERQTAREGNTAPCSFRISSEGLPLILPYISKQVLTASPPDFKHLLQYKTIKFADFVDSEFGQKASNLMLGSCVVILGKGSKATPEDIKVDKSTIAIGCWKGRASLTVMVTAVDCEELLERLMLRSEIKNGSSIQKEDEEKEKHSNGAAVDIPDVNDITGE